MSTRINIEVDLEFDQEVDTRWVQTQVERALKRFGAIYVTATTEEGV